MNFKSKVAALLAVSAMLMVPAAALAGGPAYAPEKPHPPHPTKPLPGPKASMPEKAAAYGVKCRKEKRTHVKGMKGTPFSQCVNAMARAANGKPAKVACKKMLKKHVVKGEKGTPFSRCIKHANQVRKAAKRA